MSTLKLSEEEGYAAFNVETAFALSSVQDMPLSTSSAIYRLVG